MKLSEAYEGQYVVINKYSDHYIFQVGRPYDGPHTARHSGEIWVSRFPGGGFSFAADCEVTPVNSVIPTTHPAGDYWADESLVQLSRGWRHLAHDEYAEVRELCNKLEERAQYEASAGTVGSSRTSGETDQ